MRTATTTTSRFISVVSFVVFFVWLAIYSIVGIFSYFGFLLGLTKYSPGQLESKLQEWGDKPSV